MLQRIGGELAGYSIGYLSDRGLSPDRPVNEDCYGIREAPSAAAESARGRLFVVADGMGGLAAGDVASRIAVDALYQQYYQAAWTGDPKAALAGAITLANQAIWERSHGSGRMGSTLTAAVILGGKVHFAHVGDSRCYLYRGGQLAQLTEDHSYVGGLVKQGTITREQARVHPERNKITKALGIKPTVELDVGETAFRSGDTLVLSTDGLHGEVSDAELAGALALTSVQAACDKLQAIVKGRGAPDNLTMIAVRVGAVQGSPARPAAPRTRRARTRKLLPLVASAAGVGALALVVVLVFSSRRKPASTPHTAERQETSTPAESVEPIPTGPTRASIDKKEEELVNAKEEIGEEAAREMRKDWKRVLDYERSFYEARDSSNYPRADTMGNLALSLLHMIGERLRR